MAYNAKWTDHNQTSEPCPICGMMLRWTRFYDTRTDPGHYRRALKCANRSGGCGYVSEGTKEHGLDARKGIVDIEVIKARAR